MLRGYAGKFVGFMVVFVMLFSFILVANADEQAVTQNAGSGIKVLLNGKQLEFDVEPTMIDDRTMVPLRVIFESLSLKLQWEEETSTIFGFKDDKIIVLQIGNSSAYINGGKYDLDVSPVIINDRTLVPIRFVAESTGAKVEWDEANSTVLITTAAE